MTECMVGVMTGMLKSDAPASLAIESAENLLHASGEALPEWFTEDLVVRVKERMRRLEGEWKGTPFGSTMTLAFEVD
jgi:hypothetical protein